MTRHSGRFERAPENPARSREIASSTGLPEGSDHLQNRRPERARKGGGRINPMHGVVGPVTKQRSTRPSETSVRIPSS
jgi:hypothetical protein